MPLVSFFSHSEEETKIAAAVDDLREREGDGYLGLVVEGDHLSLVRRFHPGLSFQQILVRYNSNVMPQDVLLVARRARAAYCSVY